MTGFDALTLDELRRRRSAKWSVFPADVLPAWVAEMDVALAPPIADALARAVAESDVGYAQVTAVAPAFAAWAARNYGWAVDPKDVLGAPDVLVALAEVLRVVTPPDAGVVIATPVYGPFFHVIPEVARRIVPVPLRRDDGVWRLDDAALERAFRDGARAFVLCSPHNPLGRVFTRDELARVAELAKRYGIVVIADEIHAPLTLAGATHTPFLAVARDAGLDDAVGLWSASKAWNLAGLKCAQIVAGSAAMRERLRALPAELPYRAGHLGALAHAAAYEHGDPWRLALLAHLERNRTLLAELLREAVPAVRFTPPQASYLAWLECEALGFEREPVDVFLARGRVALSRGSDFGPEGVTCARLNFATTSTILREIVARLAAAT